MDLANAYDKMEWSFIEESMELLHFPHHIINLICACMSTASFCISWYGCPSNSFRSSRGLHQGDPMSPLLFVIALERLSHCIQDAVLDGTWTPLKFERGGPAVSHLLFADDILLVSEASASNAQKISDILDVFASYSGQIVNKGKYCILFSQNTPFVTSLAISNQLGIAMTTNIGRYLGIPIITGGKGKADFTFLVDKICSKLSGWKASILSQAGRISLAQSCIFSIPTYIMQTSKLPAATCDEVERLCHNFIWGSSPEVHKNHLVSWETICSPKDQRGLGFRSLRMVNTAHLMKLDWGLLTNKDALWAHVLRFKYGYGNLNIPSIKCTSRASHLWRRVCQAWLEVEKGIMWTIQNGLGVRFWQDPWVPGMGSLSNRSLVDIQGLDWHNTVAAFFDQGHWNWPLLQQCLPLLFVLLSPKFAPPPL